MSADPAAPAAPDPTPDPVAVVPLATPEPGYVLTAPVVPRPSSLGLSDDTWARLSSLLAIAVGFTDLWYFHALGATGAQDFIIAGFTALGVHTMVKVRV